MPITAGRIIAIATGAIGNEKSGNEKKPGASLRAFC
jgi:hypothetical protein